MKKFLLCALAASVTLTGCNAGSYSAAVPGMATPGYSQGVTKSATDIIKEQDSNYTNYIQHHDITNKVDNNDAFKQLGSAEYKAMSVQYAEIDIPDDLLANGSKQQFFDNLVTRFLVNKYGPTEVDSNLNKYLSAFMFYLNRPLPAKSSTASQLHVGVFNEATGIKIIIPTNKNGSIPLAMIIANYGINPLNSSSSLFKDPASTVFEQVIGDGKNNPGLLWSNLGDNITAANYKYVLDQVEYSAGAVIGSSFKGSTYLFNDDLAALNAALYDDRRLLAKNIKIEAPSPYLNQMANVSYIKYEHEVIIPELKIHAARSKYPLSAFIGNSGTFIRGGNLDYQGLHEFEADYVSYMYNDLDNKPANTTAIKKKAIHIHNMIQAMQMFGDANTRLARTIYYAYLFKHGLNKNNKFEDFSPIMGDSPVYKANLKMLNSVSENNVTDFMLKTFTQSGSGFSQSSFIDQNVTANIKNLFDLM